MSYRLRHIVVIKDEDKINFEAYFAKNPSIKVSCSFPDEAIGKLVREHQEKFDVEILDLTNN